MWIFLFSSACAITCTETVDHVSGPVIFPDGKQVNYNQLRRDSTNLINTDHENTSNSCSGMVVDCRGATEELTSVVSPHQQTATCNVPQFSYPYYEPSIFNEPPEVSAREPTAVSIRSQETCRTSQLTVQEAVGNWEVNGTTLHALRSDLRQTTYSNQNLPIPSHSTDTFVLPDTRFSGCRSAIEGSNFPLQFTDRAGQLHI